MAGAPFCLIVKPATVIAWRRQGRQGHHRSVALIVPVLIAAFNAAAIATGQYLSRRREARKVVLHDFTCYL
jgi:hypothetical protein